MYMSRPPDRVETEIVVVGFGGCGVNAVNTLYRSAKGMARLIAVDADANTLYVAKADHLIQIGEALTRGRGTGGDISLGRRIAEEDADKVVDAIGTPDMVLAIAGLGGGVGSGATSYVLTALRERSPNTIIGASVSIPFKYEGIERMRNAQIALRELLDVTDFVIVNLNDMLVRRYGMLPIKDAFRMMDDMIVKSIAGILDLLNPEGAVIHTDFSDFGSVVKKSGVSVFGYGTQVNIVKATETAINSGLLDADLSTARGALLFLKAPVGTNLRDAAEAPRLLSEKYGIERIMWGLKVAPLIKRIEVMTLVCGVESKTVNEMLREIGGG